MAATQGLREIPGQRLDQALAEALRPKAVLMILDNCEHVIQACAELAETLLRACPDLRLLATSREALNIAGEAVLSVPSLSLPDARHIEDVSAVLHSEAVRLFADRVRTVKPDFNLTVSNVATVAQICRQLDGIPLAIELVAARVGLLRVEQIVNRLDNRFNLLFGGKRTAPARHQTLGALIDWSYDLLSQTERTMLGRLSVFVGGWTLESAEAICSGDGIEESTVFNLLTQLVSKSLAVAQREPSRETRYRSLETIREYTLQRLIESGEAEAVRGRHARWFLALAERAKPTEANRGEWMEQFVAERDNLRVALDWAFENAPELGLQLLLTLMPFWWHGGYVSEVYNYMTRALAITEANGTVKMQGAISHMAGSSCWMFGDYVAARAFYQKSVKLRREIGDKSGLANSLVLLGRMMNVLNDSPDIARSLQEEGVIIRRSLGDKYGLAVSLQYMGASVAAQSDEMPARLLLEESVAAYRELGITDDLATPLGYLGYIALRQGEYAEARSLFEESLRLWRASHHWGIAWRLEGFAGLAVKEEEPERAARLYGAAQALLDSVSARLDSIDRLGYEQYVAAAREQLGEVAFAKAWAEGRAMTKEDAIAYALKDSPGGWLLS